MKPVILLLPLLLSGLAISAPSLSQQLRARAEASSKKIPANVREEYAKGIQSVRDSKVTASAKQVGDKAPDFTLKNATGEDVTLSTLLKDGPVILTWYRGGWCPYCNIALNAMQEKLPEFKKAGATLVALTPELPDKSLETTEKHHLEFQVLTDLNHQVAKQYGLVFKLTPEVAAIYHDKFNLTEYNGKEAGDDSLPLAATYIINPDGTIKWAFLDADYRNRAEPDDIVKALAK